MTLIEALKLPEGKTIEFKLNLSSPERVLRTIVAFANTSGGVLFIGIEDQTKKVKGVLDPLDLAERLANIISDNIQPTLIPDIDIIPWRKTHVISVRVYPSASRPFFLKSLGPERGVFIRLGSTNRQADQFFIEECKRINRNETFDEQPIPILRFDSIDFQSAIECFKSIRNLKKMDLKTLKILTVFQGKTVPTVGGVLLFGKSKERAKYFPDAWIQVGCFAGEDRVRFIDTAEIRTSPIRAIEEVLSFVKRNIARRSVIGELRRVDTWSYPLVAIREALINAIVHADYSQQGAPIRVSIYENRLEIENPGLLPLGLTIEEIQGGISKLRNRVLGRVFHELGLIEQWGSGIQRMISVCQDSGLPTPLFEEIGTHFKVTFYSEPRGPLVVDEYDQRILDSLSVAKGLSTQFIAKEIELSTRATRSRLRSLVERGLIIEIGSSPNDPQKLYSLSLRRMSRSSRSSRRRST